MHLAVPGIGTVNGGGGIYLWRPGEHETRLLSSSAPRDQPAWSPNGKQIALAKGLCSGVVDCSSAGRPEAVFVASSDGGNERQLTFPVSDELRSDYPSWSPDGRRIAFLRELTDYQRLEIVSVANGSTRLLRIHGNINDPAWGKPGIAYLDTPHQTIFAPDTIRIADPRTGRGRPFASPTAGYGFQSIAWSKQGDLAALEDRLKYESRRETVTTYTGTGRRLTQFRVPERWNTCGITWSPDGTRLLITAYLRQHFSPKTTRFLPLLFSVDPHGKQWRRLRPGLPLSSCSVSWR